MLPTLHDLVQFVPLGLALGAVYGVSGVGIVVLYRTTGVLNLAYGAIGALGAFIACELLNNEQRRGARTGSRTWRASLFGGAVTLAVRARVRARCSPLATRSSRRRRRSA